MIPVYSTRLTIYASPEQPTESPFNDVASICHRWARAIAANHGVILPESLEEEYSCSSDGNEARFVSVRIAIDGNRAWRIIGSHPYRNPSDNLTMRIELEVRDDDTETVVTLRLLLESLVDSIRPLNLQLRRPRLLIDLLDAFKGRVSSGNLRATRYVTRLTADEVESSLVEKINKPDRNVPIVVLSMNTKGDYLLADHQMDEMANQLAGLGRIFTLPDIESGNVLTSHLTETHTCIDGAMRIYWPDFQITDHRFHHTHYLPQVRSHEYVAHLPEMVFHEVAAASAIGIGSDRETWRLFEHQAARLREQEVDDLRLRLDQQLQESRAGIEIDRQAAEALLVEAERQFSNLQRENQDAWKEIERLEQERDNLTASMLTAEHRVNVAEDALLTGLATKASENLEHAVSMWNSRSAEDLVKTFAAYYCDESSLVFLPEAYSSASQVSRSVSLPRLLEMLARIRKVAHRYHQGSDLGHKAMFEEEGESDYSANVSDTAKQQYRKDYKRRYVVDGEEQHILLGPHVSTGGGSPNTSAGCYWYVDSKRRRFVIGHIGRHLRGRRDT